MLLQSQNPVRNNAGRSYREIDQSQKFRGVPTTATRNSSAPQQKTDYFQNSATVTAQPVRFGQTFQLKQWLNTRPSPDGREAILSYLIDITNPCRKNANFAFPVVKDVMNDLKKAQESTAEDKRAQYLENAKVKLEKRADQIHKLLNDHLSKYRSDLDKAYLYYEMAEIYRNQALIAKLLNLVYLDQQSINPHIEKCKENYQQGQLLILEMKKNKQYPDKLPSVEKAYKTCDILKLI